MTPAPKPPSPISHGPCGLCGGSGTYSVQGADWRWRTWPCDECGADPAVRPSIDPPAPPPVSAPADAPIPCPGVFVSKNPQPHPLDGCLRPGCGLARKYHAHAPGEAEEATPDLSTQHQGGDAHEHVRLPSVQGDARTSAPAIFVTPGAAADDSAAPVSASEASRSEADPEEILP